MFNFSAVIAATLMVNSLDPWLAALGGIHNATIYGATKAGILAMTKSFARHYLVE